MTQRDRWQSERFGRIELWNHTAYPSRMLGELLDWAAAVAGVPGDEPIAVKVTAPRSKRYSNPRYGQDAYRAIPLRAEMAGHTRRWIFQKYGEIPGKDSPHRFGTAVGWVWLRLPAPMNWWEMHRRRRHLQVRALANEGTREQTMLAADWIVESAVHEMTHIRDYREGRHDDDYYRGVSNGRRQAWAKRPIEQAAIAAARRARVEHETEFLEWVALLHRSCLGFSGIGRES